MIDLGCGSGRLFAPLLAGGATRLVGIDGSPSLLQRAEARIAADAQLAAARAEGRIELEEGDVRRVRRGDHFALAVMAGVVAHLDGPEDALRALVCARRLLAKGGVLVVDTLGPGGLPAHDLPLSVDWERSEGGRRMVRRSRLERQGDAGRPACGVCHAHGRRSARWYDSAAAGQLAALVPISGGVGCPRR